MQGFLLVVGILTAAGAILGAVVTGLWVEDVNAAVGFIAGAAIGAVVGVVLGIIASSQ